MTRQSPYNPHLPGNNYQPPEALVNRIVDGVLVCGEHFAVAGASKSGKSSLLAHLQTRFDNTVLITPDRYEKPTSAAVFADLLRAFTAHHDIDAKELAKEPYLAFCQLAEHDVRERPQPHVVLIDDADDLFGHPGTARLPNHLHHMVSHNLKLRPRLRLVMVHGPGGQHPELPDAAKDVTAQLHLDRLDPDQVRAVARAHLPPALLPDDNVLYLHQITKGRPFIVIGALDNLWFLTQGPDRPAAITEKEIHLAVQRFQESYRLQRLPDYPDWIKERRDTNA